MDFIAFQANEIYEEITIEGFSHQKSVSHIRDHANNFEDHSKIGLLKKLRDKFQAAYNEHLKECNAEIPTECDENKRYIKPLYFLNQDIVANEHVLATTPPNEKSDFATEERTKSDERNDQIFRDLQELKESWT